LIRKLTEMGADIRVHDPYVKHWWEFKNQDVSPASSHSKKQFFRNQDELSKLQIEKDMGKAMQSVDCVVLAVKHKIILTLSRKPS